MPRVCLLLIAFSLLPNLAALAEQTSSSPVEIAYAVEFAWEHGSAHGATLLHTFNIDLDTGEATEQGGTTLLPQDPEIVPSPDGHFLYVIGLNQAYMRQYIWVYPTDSQGVPGPPIQKLDVADILQFEIDPTGTLAYVLQWSTNTTIRVYHIDPTTGLLSTTSQVVADLGEGPCGSSGFPQLLGFDSSGSQLYDSWVCSGWDDGSAYYYSYEADKRTGTLGAYKLIFTWGSSDGGPYQYVSITDQALIDLLVTGGEWNTVFVFTPLGGKRPVIACSARMLFACGKATNSYADPMGEYLFLQVGADFDIARIDLQEGRITDTGSAIPAAALTFSPDRRVIYAQSSRRTSSPVNSIYLFDPDTAELKQGGAIGLPASYLIPAVRR